VPVPFCNFPLPPIPPLLVPFPRGSLTPEAVGMPWVPPPRFGLRSPFLVAGICGKGPIPSISRLFVLANGSSVARPFFFFYGARKFAKLIPDEEVFQPHPMSLLPFLSPFRCQVCETVFFDFSLLPPLARWAQLAFLLADPHSGCGLHALFSLQQF